MMMGSNPPEPSDFSVWKEGWPQGNGLKADVQAFLVAHHRPATFAHVRRVAGQAVRLAGRFGANPDQAGQAGWLHDISAVIPNGRRLATARSWGLPILPEEEAFPMLLHQQLSAVLAREVFNIHDGAVLSAIACHTTLRGDASLLDMVVFVADKIAWDQAGKPPYLTGLLDALEGSLAGAARYYLAYLEKHASGPLHPWAREALLKLPA